MKEQDPRNRAATPDAVDHDLLISAYLEGRPEETERLTALLTDTARRTVRHFFGRNVCDADDLAQDSVMAVLLFLRRRGGFSGNLVNFTIAVVRNRCRNWAIWKNRHPTADSETTLRYLRDPQASPLDLLAEREVLSLLRESLLRLEATCRKLLQALFLEGVSPEEMRRRAGLKTVQAIYYRRARCLESLGELLKKRLRHCSSDGRTGNG